MSAQSIHEYTYTEEEPGNWFITIKLGPFKSWEEADKAGERMLDVGLGCEQNHEAN